MTNIGKDVEKREHLDTVGIVIWYSHCEKCYGDSSKKLKIGLLLYDPSIPLLGIYLKKMKTLIKKDIFMPMFRAALFILTMIRKQPKGPSDERIKMWYVCVHTHTHNGISLSYKKNEILPFTTM